MIFSNGLGKLVVAETTDGGFAAIGQMVQYTDQPTAVIRLPDGTMVSWVASIVREATDGERAIVERLTPSQSTCPHDKSYGRLTFEQATTLCARCKKAVGE